MHLPIDAALCTLVCLASSARGQGADSCTNPTDIGSVVGSVLFDNLSCTTGTEGQNESLCNFGGTSAITNDVWYVWTAPSTGTFRISLGCHVAPSQDWKMAVYAGAGCPSAPSIACSDDGCGVSPDVVVHVIAGQFLTLQIGKHAGDFNGNGQINIQDVTLPCASSTGPDLVVSEITDVFNYAGNGSIDAISLGFRVANLGQSPSDWNAATDAHPVFAQNLYRWKSFNGAFQFEQVGQSWLRHPEDAVNGASYCSCLPGGSSVALGAGCGEEYLGAEALPQAELAPRWQVSAFDGSFAWPPANPPYAGELARRLQFGLDEVPPFLGTTLTAEVMAIGADDALMGASFNNASWIKASVSSSTSTNVNLNKSGLVTHVGEPAIYSWRAQEPQVRIVELAVPGDGRIVVGSRATLLPTGQTHYEYAVQNVSSDRAVGSFSIPIPSGIAVWNVGFHDVVYREGDGPGGVEFSSVDWSWSQAGGVLTWQTESRAQNPSANAIRWGTTYNFRFDAGASPMDGPAELGLWVPGTPASASAMLDVPGSPSSDFGYCYGRGMLTPCPCGNYDTNANVERGCAHSGGSGGGLKVSGSQSIANDTLHLDVAYVPSATSCIFLQGTGFTNGGLGTPFGDGLLCAGGTLLRIGSKLAVNGICSFPGAADGSLSSLGQVGAGDVRNYQVWYRNSASFCTPAPSNQTNGYQITWQP